MFSVFVCSYHFTNQVVQVLDISVKFLFLYQMKCIYFNVYTRCLLVQFGSSENEAILQQVILYLNTSKRKKKTCLQRIMNKACKKKLASNNIDYEHARYLLLK